MTYEGETYQQTHTKTKARLKIEDTLYLISGINCAIVIIPQVPSIFADPINPLVLFLSITRNITRYL